MGWDKNRPRKGLCARCGHKNDRLPEAQCSKCIEKRLKERDAYIVRRLARYSNFNLDLHEYKLLEKYQQGKCAICGNSNGVNSRGLPKRLVADHDHETGLLRELLCRQCNLALGNAQDDPQLLRRMALYIEKHRLRSLE